MPVDPLSMERLLHPRSVGVIGATERRAPAGGVFRNLLEAGFRGRLFPIHPSAESIHGVPAVPQIGDLLEPVDCVVIGLSADKVIEALEQAAAAGTRAAVVLASGYAELGPDGWKRQADLVAVAQRTNMAVCGPNCLGLVNVGAGIPLYSATVWKDIPKGRLAIVSHSGSATVSLGTSGRLGLSYVVSSGNSAVCDMADYLCYLARDEQTAAVALFMETLRSPAAFERAMEAMHASGKPVVALRVGRSASGAAASAAHTGSLVSSDEAFAAFFRRIGVIAVDDMDELIETSCLLTGLKKKAAKPGIGLINVSGGEVAHACDVADGLGINFPALAADTTRRLETILPSFATARNPLDVTGAVFADPTLYPRCLETLASDPSVGVLAVLQDAPLGLSAAGARNYRPIAEHVAAYSQKSEKPVVFISNLAVGVHPHARQPLEDAGVPVLCGTRAALKAVHNAAVLSPAIALGRVAEPLPAQSEWIARLQSGQPFDEHETKCFLADHGISVTRERLVRDAEECAAAAAAIGFPVALKIASKDVPHKSDVGGVALGVESARAAAETYVSMIDSVVRLTPAARIEGVLVQEMVTGGVEAIVGLTRHPPFGLAVVVGSGGVFVEVLKDAAIGLPPLGEDAARFMIDSTKLSTLMSGYRGAPAADLDALVGLVVAVANIACSYGDWIEALDINPVSVLPAGRGVTVLDALLVCAGGAADGSK
jgi:acyl-CoA synthetase (NDP forming)